MNSEEVKRCRDEYLEGKEKIIEKLKNELWKHVLFTINKQSKEGTVISHIQLYKRKKKIWLRVKPELSRSKSRNFNIDEKRYHSTRNIPWTREVIEAFKSELGEFFTIKDEEELEKYNQLTLLIEWFFLKRLSLHR